MDLDLFYSQKLVLLIEINYLYDSPFFYARLIDKSGL